MSQFEKENKLIKSTLLGNGYPCSFIDEQLEKMKDGNSQTPNATYETLTTQ